MNKCKEFVIMLWNDISKNMRPWAKIILGIPLFIVVLISMPFCLVVALIMAAILFSIDWIGKKIKPFIFKDSDPT